MPKNKERRSPIREVKRKKLSQEIEKLISDVTNLRSSSSESDSSELSESSEQSSDESEFLEMEVNSGGRLTVTSFPPKNVWNNSVSTKEAISFGQSEMELPTTSNQHTSEGISYHWEEIDVSSRVPHNALCAGHDCDGSKIYVGKAFHEGDWIPSKVIPIKHVAYLAYNGKEHAKNRCQVLCGQLHRFQWVRASNGTVPPCSIEGGKTASGETLYIGRVNHFGSQTVGKVHPSHRVCYISFGGKELPFNEYEILIMRG